MLLDVGDGTRGGEPYHTSAVERRTARYAVWRDNRSRVETSVEVGDPRKDSDQFPARRASTERVVRPGVARHRRLR